MTLTLHPGILKVASASPDPPFEVMQGGSQSGFDVALMQAISSELGLTLQRISYSGDDFNDIFDGLAKNTYDAVTSGTTITPERSKIVLFSRPYMEFNQGVAVNRQCTPNVSSPADLHGLTAGIQSGNTSEFVAQRWLAQGIIADVRYYPYDDILSALGDLKDGKIGLVIKLFPVISWLVKDDAQLLVSFEVPTREKLGIAFAKQNTELCHAVDAALENLETNGRLAQLRALWFHTRSLLKN